MFQTNTGIAISRFKWLWHLFFFFLLGITLIRSQDPGLFPCSHNSVLLVELWFSITSLGKRIH